MRIILTFAFFCICQNIYAQEMTSFPGFGGYQYYIDDIKIDKIEAEELMKQYPEVISEWEKSKKSLTGAYVFLGAQVGFGVWMISKAKNSDSFEDVALPYAGFLASTIGSLVYSLKANKHKKNSILLYNKRATADYNFKPSNKGLGLVMNF